MGIFESNAAAFYLSVAAVAAAFGYLGASVREVISNRSRG